MTYSRVKSATEHFGQCLDLEDLGVTAPGIDVINVTDKIPRTSELDQNTSSIVPRTVNLDQAGEDPEHDVGWRALQKDHSALVVVDHGVAVISSMNLRGMPKSPSRVSSRRVTSVAVSGGFIGRASLRNSKILLRVRFVKSSALGTLKDCKGLSIIATYEMQSQSSTFKIHYF
jgi:hypothetical protein